MNTNPILGVRAGMPAVLAAQTALKAWAQLAQAPAGFARNAAYWATVNVVQAAFPKANARAIVDRRGAWY